MDQRHFWLGRGWQRAEGKGVMARRRRGMTQGRRGMTQGRRGQGWRARLGRWRQQRWHQRRRLLAHRRRLLLATILQRLQACWKRLRQLPAPLMRQMERRPLQLSFVAAFCCSTHTELFFGALFMTASASSGPPLQPLQPPPSRTAVMTPAPRLAGAEEQSAAAPCAALPPHPWPLTQRLLTVDVRRRGVRY